MNNFKKVNFAVPDLLTFYLKGKIVGKLVIKDNKLEFIGDTDTSAKILFDKLKPAIDNYIKEKLELIN